MDNLNGSNPFVDDDDEGELLLERPKPKPARSRPPVAPVEELSLELPDLFGSYTPSGDVKVPAYREAMEDGVEGLVDAPAEDEHQYSSSDDLVASLARSFSDAPASEEEVEVTDLRHRALEEEEVPLQAVEQPVPSVEAVEVSASSSPFDDDPMAALATLIATQTGTYEDDDEEEDDERHAAIPDRKEVAGSFELPADDDEDELAGFDIDEVLAKAIDVGASDVHLNAEDQVAYTVLGDIVRVSDYGLVTPTITQRLQLSIISHVLEDAFAVALELDTSYVLRTGRHRGRRTRLNVGKSLTAITLTFRIVSDVIPTPDELGVSGELLEWANLPSGLVLVCGPTNTGKSTTFASILRKIQLERPVKIVTIEKPIEYIYGSKGKALVVQREVGLDARSYSAALDSAMRQAPDVIMVGEVRNQEEIEALMRASESGHLALSTMHSSSPSATINRISSMFTGDDRVRVLGSLEDNLRGLVNQVLVKSPDGKSRKAVREVLAIDDEVALLVGAGDGRGIRAYQMKHGITMDHELVKAVRKGWCTVAEARTKSAYPRVFDELVSGSR